MLTVLAALAVVAVIGVTAVLATRDGQVLADAPPDRPDTALPAGVVLPEDVAALRFPLALRGYAMADVDDALDRLAGELAVRDVLISELESGRDPVGSPVGPATPAARDEAAAPAPSSPAPVDHQPASDDSAPLGWPG